jgi:hypothetical protein
MSGTYKEYFLLFGSCAYTYASQAFINYVCTCGRGADRRDMGYKFFREYVLANQKTLDVFISGLLTIIKRDR